MSPISNIAIIRFVIMVKFYLLYDQKSTGFHILFHRTNRLS